MVCFYIHPYEHKLFDIEFLKLPDLTASHRVPAIAYYYQHHTNLPNVNCLIPISKHYEENENVFSVILPIIRSYRANNAVYAFNNGPLTRVFHEIESQGIQCRIICVRRETNTMLLSYSIRISVRFYSITNQMRL